MSLRKSALLISLTAGVVFVLPTAWAQEQPMVDVPTARNAVAGEITGSSVNVRSGPAESYYPTMQLQKGDKVTVVGHKFDWLKIVPPQGSFSYIAKLYVDRDGAGTAGTVNRDDVLVRAGSVMNDLKAQPQTKLNKGASVQIVGEADEYYKIAPPPDAFVYVAKQFVAQVGEAAPTETVPAAEAAVAVEQPKKPTAETVTTPKPSPAPKPVAEPRQPRAAEPATADAETDFRKLERRFEQLKNQPLDEQPISELLKGYSELQQNTELSATSQRMVAFRLTYLQAAEKQQQQLIAAKQDAADFAARQMQVEQQQKQIEQRIQEQGIAVFAAVGQLQTSMVQKDGSPLMRLVDPADNRTLIYIQTADVKQRGLVGKYVGVRGEVQRDPQLSLDYIEPLEMMEIDGDRVLKGITAKIYPPSVIKRNTAQ